jgi:hypothetical protein
MKKLVARFAGSARAAAWSVLLLSLTFLPNLNAQNATGAGRLVTREDLAGKKWDFRSTALPGKVFTGIWVFNANKTMSKGTGPMSEWSIRGKTLRVEHENNNWQVFSLENHGSNDGPLVMKEVDSSAGKRDGITLTQSLK